MYSSKWTDCMILHTERHLRCDYVVNGHETSIVISIRGPRLTFPKIYHAEFSEWPRLERKPGKLDLWRGKSAKLLGRITLVVAAPL
jgi:hypothetical protein